MFGVCSRKLMQPVGPTVLNLSVLLWICLGLAGGASATSINPDPVTFEFSGLGSGEISLVGESVGLPVDAILLAGSVAPTDTVLLFSAEVLGGDEVKRITLELLGEASTGAGWIDDPSGAVDWKQADAAGDGWAFKPDGAKLKVGTGPSDVFFVSFASMPPSGSLSFAIEYMNGTGNESVTALFSTTPEPSTALLLGLGMLGLTCFSRGRTRRAP